jgi:hypothetical protein
VPEREDRVADVAGQIETLLQKWERKEFARYVLRHIDPQSLDHPPADTAYRRQRTELTAAVYQPADTIVNGVPMVDAIEEVPEAGTALAIRKPATLMRPIAAPKDILIAQEETRALIQETLKEGRDYGTIPGVNKPSLFKPGAERVQMAFGCFVRYRIVEQEVDHNRKVEWRKKKRVYNNAHKDDNSYHEEEVTGESLGLYRYVVEAQIVHRDSGEIVGECIGVCSTMEAKYVDRPRECENTALKMAEKRAHVGAVLNAFGLSEQFTQDVEDQPEDMRSNGNRGPAAPTTLTAALDFVMPFGPKTKGKKLREIPVDDLEKARDWAKGVKKFSEFIAAAEIVISEAAGAPSTAAA